MVVGHDSSEGAELNQIVADAIADEAQGVAMMVVFGGNIELLLLIIDGCKVPFIEELELLTGSTPMFDELVAAARILPTILVASPMITATMLVACCT